MAIVILHAMEHVFLLVKGLAIIVVQVLLMPCIVVLSVITVVIILAKESVKTHVRAVVLHVPVLVRILVRVPVVMYARLAPMDVILPVKVRAKDNVILLAAGAVKPVVKLRVIIRAWEVATHLVYS